MSTNIAVVPSTTEQAFTTSTDGPILVRPQAQRFHSSPGITISDMRSSAPEPVVLQAQRPAQPALASTAPTSTGLSSSVDQAYSLSHDQVSPTTRKAGSSLQSTLFSPLRSHAGMSLDDFAMGMAWTPGLNHGLGWGIAPSPRYRSFGLSSFDFSAVTPMQKDFPRAAGSTDVMMVPITPTMASITAAAAQSSTGKNPTSGQAQAAAPTQSAQGTSPRPTRLSPPAASIAGGNLTIRIPSPRLFASTRFASVAADTFSPPSPSSGNESFKQGWFKRDIGATAAPAALDQSSSSGTVQPGQSLLQQGILARGHSASVSSASTLNGTHTFAESMQGEDMMGKVIIIGPVGSTSVGGIDAHDSYVGHSSSEESMTEDESENESEAESVGPGQGQGQGPSSKAAHRIQSATTRGQDTEYSPSCFLQLSLHDPPPHGSSRGRAATAGTALQSVTDAEGFIPFPASNESGETDEEEEMLDDEEEAEDIETDFDDDGDGDADGEDDEAFDEAANGGVPTNAAGPTRHHFSIFGDASSLSKPIFASAGTAGQRRTDGSVSSRPSTGSQQHATVTGPSGTQGGAKRRSRPTAAAARDRSSSILSTSRRSSGSRLASSAGTHGENNCATEMISSILGGGEGGASRSRASSLRSNFSGRTTNSESSLASAFGALGGGIEPIEYHGLAAGLEPLEDLAQQCRDATTNKAKAPIMEKFAAEWMDHFYEEDDQGTVNRAYMNQSYRVVCRTYRIQPLNPSAFGRLVRTQFPNISTRRLGPRGNSRYHYTGLIAKNATSTEETPSEHSERSIFGLTASKGSTTSIGSSAKPSVVSSSAAKVLGGTIRANVSPARKSGAPVVPSSSRVPSSSIMTPDSSPWIGNRPELRRTFSDTYSSASGTNPFFFVPPPTGNDEGSSEIANWTAMVPQAAFSTNSSLASSDGTTASSFPLVFFDSPATTSAGELPVFDSGRFAFNAQTHSDATPAMASLAIEQVNLNNFSSQQMTQMLQQQQPQPQQGQQQQPHQQAQASMAQLGDFAQLMSFLEGQQAASGTSTPQGLGLFYVPGLPQTTLAGLQPPVMAQSGSDPSTSTCASASASAIETFASTTAQVPWQTYAMAQPMSDAMGAGHHAGERAV